MMWDTLKPVSFPLIIPVKKKPQQKTSASLYFWGIVSFFVVFVLVVLIGGIEALQIFGIVCYVIATLYFRVMAEDIKPNAGEEKYLRDKNRIRMDASSIIVTINEQRNEFIISELTQINIFYFGYARDDFRDEVITGTGIRNRITFEYQGVPHDYTYYLDNKVWAILFDKVLFNWAWQGIVFNIYYKGQKMYKLPIED